MDNIVITGGKLRTLGIERPSTDQIITLAAAAFADGFALAGSGPIRRVAGSTITIIVSAGGCTCSLWRTGSFCHHMAMYLVETGRANAPKPSPAPIPFLPRRERQGWTRHPLRVIHPVTPIRPRIVA